MKSKEFIDLCESYGVDPNNVPEITSFEAACKAIGDDPESLPDVARCAERHQKRLINDYKLSIIADALRGGNNVDYTNRSEWKHFPVFAVQADAKRPSGFGLSYDGYGGRVTCSVVGVRLCFQNEDVAIFFGKHFIDLHTDHQLPT